MFVLGAVVRINTDDWTIRHLNDKIGIISEVFTGGYCVSFDDHETMSFDENELELVSAEENK